MGIGKREEIIEKIGGKKWELKNGKNNNFSYIFSFENIMLYITKRNKIDILLYKRKFWKPKCYKMKYKKFCFQKLVFTEIFFQKIV